MDYRAMVHPAHAGMPPLPDADDAGNPQNGRAS
jgi:hypothetical protein